MADDARVCDTLDGEGKVEVEVKVEVKVEVEGAVAGAGARSGARSGPGANMCGSLFQASFASG
jgi:hypothetical protein